MPFLIPRLSNDPVARFGPRLRNALPYLRAWLPIYLMGGGAADGKGIKDMSPGRRRYNAEGGSNNYFWDDAYTLGKSPAGNWVRCIDSAELIQSTSLTTDPVRYTWWAWMRTNTNSSTSSTNRRIHFGSDAFGMHYEHSNINFRCSAYHQTSGSTYSGANFNGASASFPALNVWAMFCGTWDGQDIRAYYNGKFVEVGHVSSLTSVASTTTGGINWFSASSSDNRNNDFYEFGYFHNYCMNAAEVKYLYDRAPRSMNRFYGDSMIIMPGTAGASPQTVNAGLASATATAHAPSGAGSGVATVSPAVASAVANALAASGSGSGAVVVSPAVASVIAQAFQPAGSGSGIATVSPGIASAGATAHQPVGSGTGVASVSPGVASASAGALAPSGSGSGVASVAAGLAVATAVAHEASASLGSGPQTVNAGLASATAAAHQPSATGAGTATVTANLASAIANALNATGQGSGAVVVNAGLAIAVATAHSPVATSGGIVVNADIASATANAHSPSATGTGSATALAGVATAIVNAFQAAGSGSGVVTVNAGLASAAAVAYAAQGVAVVLEVLVKEDLTVAWKIYEDVTVTHTIKENVTIA